MGVYGIVATGGSSCDRRRGSPLRPAPRGDPSRRQNPPRVHVLFRSRQARCLMRRYVPSMKLEPHVRPRRITLERAFNFRDLGGYSASAQRTVRWGLIYRADGIHRIEGADLARVAALGIRTVLDLRTRGELADHGRGPGRVDRRHVPASAVAGTGVGAGPARRGGRRGRLPRRSLPRDARQGRELDRLCARDHGRRRPASARVPLLGGQGPHRCARGDSAQRARRQRRRHRRRLRVEPGCHARAGRVGSHRPAGVVRDDGGAAAGVPRRPAARDAPVPRAAHDRKYGSLTDYVRGIGLADAQIDALRDHVAELRTARRSEPQAYDAARAVLRPLAGSACAQTIWRNSSTARQSVSTLVSSDVSDSDDARCGLSSSAAASCS